MRSTVLSLALAIGLACGHAYAQGPNGGYSGGFGGSGGRPGGSEGPPGGFGPSSFENIPFGGDFEKARHILIAHGVLASLAFVVLFPTGSILIRLASFPGLWWVHGAFQIFTYVIFIMAVGLGAYFASQIRQLDHYHPIIGLVLLAVLFLQPVFGVLHHKLFKKYRHRSFWSYMHIWIGRCAIILGMINGGLGLKFANNSSRGAKIAYGVVAGIMGVLYIGSAIYGESLRRKRVQPATLKEQQKEGRYEQSAETERDAARV